MRQDSFQLVNVQDAANQSTSSNGPAPLSEAKRRKIIAQHENAANAVSELEERLNIAVRWEPGSFEWQDAAKLVANRRYQRALDHLEGLIVARMLELTRMNMARTGES